MRITELRAENFKRLKAVDITPGDANTVVIAGRNAQGKSSVLDAIWAALAGKKGAVEQPVRQGEKNASVRIVLDNLVVTRTWKATGGTNLVVESATGARFPSPQAVLDQMLGEFSFDPLAFANAKPRDQRDTLLELVGLDLDAFEVERKRHYDERTIVNREVKRLQGALASLPEVRSDTPREEVDIVALSERHRELRDDYDAYRDALQRHADLTAELARVVEEGQRLRASLPADPEEALTVLRLKMDGATETNRLATAAREHDRLSSALMHAEVDADQLSDAIAAVDEAKAAAISGAGLPVDGLGFDEDGVTLNGVPFTQASAAERLRTSVAIALASNPEIRVIRITDGSLLDSSNLAIIEEMAKERDAQIWVERVDESGSVGIVIEDGLVKEGQNG